MATDLKRKLSPGPETNGYTKRSRMSSGEGSGDNGKESAKVDPWTGMRVAFPGLDEAEDEIFYGPPSDGLEYLRQVRSEAKTVPSLLIAPKSDEDSSLDDGHGGYYKDGAYTAIANPMIAVENSMHVHEPTDVETDYHSSLLLKFRLMRADLRCLLLQEDTQPHDEAQYLVSFDKGIQGKQKLRSTLLTTVPLPHQVAQFNQSLVLKALSILASCVFGKQKNISDGVSQWIWALLAQSEDAGCLSSEEVATLRDMAKRAGALCRRVKLALKGIQADMSLDEGSQTDDAVAEVERTVDADFVEEVEAGETSGEDSLTAEDILAAKKQLLMELSTPKKQPAGFDTKPFPSETTRTTLDFILTIVGELYGQRDLLVYRNILWQD